MNILIVDDEFYSVEGVKNKLMLSQLEIDNIYCAYSMEEAQEFFSIHDIDILLSDIEMPTGSGLDLLEWIRANEFQTVAIFFTSHAEFSYASRAIKLQSTDYLLKPIEAEPLIDAVSRGIEKIAQVKEEAEIQLYAEYWQHGKTQAREIFWSNLATGKTRPSKLIMINEINTLHLTMDEKDYCWHPILLDCIRTSEANLWDDKLYEYAIKNILVEILFKHDDTSLILNVGNRQYLILLNSASCISHYDLKDYLVRNISCFYNSIPGYFKFYLGNLCSYLDIGMVYNDLNNFSKNNIHKNNSVKTCYELINSVSRHTEHKHYDEWSKILESYKFTEFKANILTYLHTINNNPYATRSDLVVFHSDFLQLIYSFLEKNGLQAHSLFKTSQTDLLSESANNSVDDMINWVNHILDLSFSSLENSAGSSSIIMEVKNYINTHISEELDRNILSAMVFLSPDYLSHLFSSNEGISLSNYIINRRIHYAKKYLLQSDMSIRDVALKSGYQNISYFSKQFKKQTGLTPLEFKNRKPI